MEGDAGTSRLNPTPDAEKSDDSEEPIAQTPEEQPAPAVPDGTARPERLGVGWVAAICAGLLVLTAGLAVVGYLALQANARSAQIGRDDAVALQAAKDCVTATQAPDTASMGASQAKIIECSTGDFGAQAGFFSGMMVEAYQAANVKVQVSDLRAAVERHNDDGSVDILVAVRTKVTNSQAADQEQGYRLRVTMQRDDGTYKIANLVQVTT
jgi:Mce-associated membrane protein